jgi:conjugative transfer signal peptidase TraF
MTPAHLTSRPRRIVVIAFALVPVAFAAVLASVIPSPSLLWNRSESEPRGLYVRSAAAPGRGQIIAFAAPPSALSYAGGRMAYLRRIPILKQVAAMPGDTICTLGGKLTINGAWRAPILSQDQEGRLLPRWQACRRLETGEIFVFSNRIPNSLDSLDSRYYGPVRREAIVGVFRPLLTESDKPGDA